MKLEGKTCPITSGSSIEIAAARKTDGGFDAATFAQQFNQFSPEYGLHFRDIYRYMRARCPVAHTDEVGGFWIVTRYADIKGVAGDDATFSSLYGVLPSANPDTKGAAGPPREKRTGPLAAYPPGPNGEAPHLTFLPLELDPPLHDVYRKAIEPLFSPNVITELAPWLLALANQLIDAIIEKGEGDFSRDLSTPLASIFTMKFLGLPLEDWSDYAWFVQSSKGSSNIQPRTKKLSERDLRERVAAEVVRQRARPVAGGAIAYLIDVTVDGRKLDSWEIEAYIWLMIGNVDGTQACMGSSFVWLSRNPEQRRRLAEEPHLIPAAVEEFLRVFSPRQAFSRTVVHDVELGGQSLKAGDHVLLCWVSGNLDEAEFENPEKVDIDRANKRHMAFGLGAHSCMAADIIRLEFRILFEQILSRVHDFGVEEAGLRPSPIPSIAAGYEHVPFDFMPGKKVGGPRIADDNKTMTPDRIRQIFKSLETGDGAAFFAHVADDVDWTVMGTHPLAGHYHSRADYAGTFAKLGKVLPHGAQLHVEHLLVKDDEAVVELRSLATATNGMRFDNRYCMVLAFDGETIVRARTYLDSAIVARLFEENPIA